MSLKETKSYNSLEQISSYPTDIREIPRIQTYQIWIAEKLFILSKNVLPAPYEVGLITEDGLVTSAIAGNI